MEAVAQFGAFLVFKIVNNSKLVPILTGTEFPDLNTMAPPGEVLTLMGQVHMKDRRDLEFNAFIENRYARTKGMIRGMVLNERLVRKMLSSFDNRLRDECTCYTQSYTAVCVCENCRIVFPFLCKKVYQ